MLPENVPMINFLAVIQNEGMQHSAMNVTVISAKHLSTLHKHTILQQMHVFVVVPVRKGLIYKKGQTDGFYWGEVTDSGNPLWLGSATFL